MVTIVRCLAPHCRKYMMIEAEYRGQTVRCLLCKSPIPVSYSSVVHPALGTIPTPAALPTPDSLPAREIFNATAIPVQKPTPPAVVPDAERMIRTDDELLGLE